MDSSPLLCTYCKVIAILMMRNKYPNERSRCSCLRAARGATRLQMQCPLREQLVLQSKIRQTIFNLCCAHLLIRRHLRNIQIYLIFRSVCSNFAKPEGRNPWVKKAFLALSHVTKSPNFSRGMRTMQRSFCFVYTAYSPRCTHEVYTTAWGICFSVHFYDGVWRCQ